MLAKRVQQLPQGRQWQYEAKFDGYRMEALKSGQSVRLLSRNGADYTQRFRSITEAVAKLNATTALLDGEVVAVDERGKPSFQMLQNRHVLPKGWRLAYYAFDLLHLDGEDLQSKPLIERRQQLESLIKNSEIRLSEVLDADVETVIKVVQAEGLEGVVAKRIDSRYESDRRSGAWVKLPLKNRQEFVIGGYRPGNVNFELLLVGYFEAGKLMFAGKVRQGLNPGIRAGVFKTIKHLRTKKCPFVNLPNNKSDHFGETVTAEEMDDYVWLVPVVVAEIKFTEWTRAGVLRHAEFVGLREDKQAKEVGKQDGGEAK
jgi:bifunctional non-homologous end joining protein LigD